MGSFAGRFQYLDRSGERLQAGACRVSYDETSLTILPDSGAPLVCDLGDIQEFSPGDFEITLKLYTGRSFVAGQFGKTFQVLCHDLLSAYRDRVVQCLLLDDLQEVMRTDAAIRFDSADRDLARSGEIRLYRSNLAALPSGAPGFQWRLADIDEFRFDDDNYALQLTAGDERLSISKLGKKTAQLDAEIRDAVSRVAEHGAAVLHRLFPFLTPDRFQQVAALMKEGRAVSVARLNAVDARIERALGENAVDRQMRPYFDYLAQRTAAAGIYAGFKFIRPEGEEEESPEPVPGEETAGTADTSAEEEPIPREIPEEERDDDVLHWFFFPLRSSSGEPLNLVAWEASTQKGRATYFFRPVAEERAARLRDPETAAAEIEAGVRTLNRALVALNFRREPVYLPDNSLEMQPRYRRYAIACRNLPFLRALRSAYRGRAVHTNPQAWSGQVDAFLGAAGGSRP